VPLRPPAVGYAADRLLKSRPFSGLAGLYHSFESNRIPLAVTERSAAAVAAAATERRTASAYLVGMLCRATWCGSRCASSSSHGRSRAGPCTIQHTMPPGWLAYIMQRTPGLQPTTHSWRNVRDAVGAHLSHTVPLSWLLRRAVAHAVDRIRSLSLLLRRRSATHPLLKPLAFVTSQSKAVVSAVLPGAKRQVDAWAAAAAAASSTSDCRCTAQQ
jgi:hypothetical protein